MNDYGKFRAKLLVRMLIAHPTPVQVANALERNQGKYPEIVQGEIDAYKSWGEAWPSEVLRKGWLLHKKDEERWWERC